MTTFAVAHGNLEKKLERAAKRIAAGDYDEAVFGAYRCLEGYLKAVFLTALFDALTEPFESRLKHVQLRERQLLNDRVFDQPQTVFLGLMAAAASGEIADGILKAIRAFRGRHAENRNATFHSLDEPDKEPAEKCLGEARSVISAVEAIFAAHVGRRVEAARKASEWAAVVRVYKKATPQAETPDSVGWQEQARAYQIEPDD